MVELTCLRNIAIRKASTLGVMSLWKIYSYVYSNIFRKFQIERTISKHTIVLKSYFRLVELRQTAWDEHSHASHVSIIPFSRHSLHFQPHHNIILYITWQSEIKHQTHSVNSFTNCVLKKLDRICVITPHIPRFTKLFVRASHPGQHDSFFSLRRTLDINSWDSNVVNYCMEPLGRFVFDPAFVFGGRDEPEEEPLLTESELVEDGVCLLETTDANGHITKSHEHLPVFDNIHA